MKCTLYFVGVYCGVVDNANRYVDTVLRQRLPSELGGLDPWVISNQNVTLDARQRISVLFTTFNVTGFRNGIRADNCLVRRAVKSSVACNFAYDSASVRAKFNLRYQGRILKNVGAVSSLDRVYGTFNATGSKNKTEKVEFGFRSIPLRGVTFSGITPQVSNALRNGFLDYAATQIRYYQQYYAQALARAAGRVPFPL